MSNELSIINDEMPDLEQNQSDNLVRIGSLILGNVPVVGSILTEVFKSVIPNQKEERVRIFVEVLAEKLKYIDKDILHVKMKSEGFTDLLEDAIPQVARALNKERQHYIASALKNSLTDEQLEHIEKKKLLQLLNELNDAEILLLYFLRLNFMENDQNERITFAEKHPHLFDEYDERERKHKDVAISNKSALRKSYMSKLQEIGLARISTEGSPIHAPWITRKYGNKDIIESVTSGNLRITALGSLFLFNIDLIEKEQITTF
jgi:hypothetical protein